MAAPYGVHGDVASRLARGSAGFSASTRPSDTDVTTWLAQVSSRFDAMVRAAGLDPTGLAGDGLNITKFAVIGYVAGMVERVWSGVTGATPDQHGQDLQATLIDLFKQLRENPSDFAVFLGISNPTSPATGSSSLGSYFTDSKDASDTAITPDRSFKSGGKF